ncbi:Hypothetical protein FKW44_000732 [Caligus rogercresseyi]|uniref:Uncharacterized protein n=1 Tax=Caligus rogercresseyi TaxID=217165 RepID=A0A7T8KHQ2_CALRO|nr:Hypothetical protein FKW44_000732 [Caligus rogercresseyi]
MYGLLPSQVYRRRKIHAAAAAILAHLLSTLCKKHSNKIVSVSHSFTYVLLPQQQLEQVGSESHERGYTQDLSGPLCLHCAHPMECFPTCLHNCWATT